MRAIYDSRARALYIDVVDPPHESDNWVDESAADQFFVHVDAHDRVVGIEVLDADDIDERTLRQLVGRRGLDPDQVLTALGAALGVPDREVTLAFGCRVAA